MQLQPNCKNCAWERDHGHSKADWRADDYTVSREFEAEGRAIQWLIGAGLAEFNNAGTLASAFRGGASARPGLGCVLLPHPNLLPQPHAIRIVARGADKEDKAAA
jgi:hypothetical protein